MDAEFIKKLEENHVALWNEKDADRRKQLIRTIYSDDVKMYDKDFVLTGHDEVLGFIGKLLSEDPNFYFLAAKPMQATQNGVRLLWNIRTSGAELTGMDFFLLKNRKVQHLYVFMNA